MITEANIWVDELGTEQCWRLVERAAIGRLGFAAEGEQLILPVNYAVDGHCIVVRTGRTVMLESLGPGATVAFEVDGADAVSETGWSVLIKGHASEMDPPGTRGGGPALALRPWTSGSRDHWLRIMPWSVTGRAISRDHRLPHGHSVPYLSSD
jgi:nitroimidazol reductase NimA-like FMN-containing flavoprotein (pyridoxamine 5'-phosphate oxidase superfamily)